MRFTPGPGVGGHCLPIDPSYLSWQVRRSLGQSFRFVELANDVNEHMPDYVVRRLVLALNQRGQAVNGSASCSSASPTSATPATPARRPAPRSPSAWPRSVRACGSPIRTCQRAPSVPYPLVELTAEELAARRRGGARHRPRRLRLRPGRAREPRYVLDTRNRLRRPAVERL